jgi:uncharacterized protein (DUF58 family)
MSFADSLRRPVWRQRFEQYLQRRGPQQPPLVIGYRQVYILPTRFGITFGVLLFAMLFGALNYNNNAALFLSFLLATSAQISTFRSWRNLSGLHIERISTQPVFAGEPVIMQIHCSEQQGLERPSLACSSSNDEQQHRFSLRPWQNARCQVAVNTRRRGWLELPRLTLATSYPLGLFRAWSYLQVGHPVLVYPAPARQPPPLPAATQSQPQRQRRLHSDNEFEGLRDYRYGDNLKAIAWKSSARNRSLISRDEPPANHSEYLLTQQQTGVASSEQQLAILTSWILLAEQRGYHYGLDLPGLHVAPAHGPEHLHACLRELALWQP